MSTKNLDWQEMQKEFLDACDVQCYKLQEYFQKRSLAGRHGMVQALNLAYNLIHEEVNTELLNTLKTVVDKNIHIASRVEQQAVMTADEATSIYDGMVDSIYVICQLANCMSLDLALAYQEVHDANMLKAIGPDGKVIRRADGKILKPQNWQPPKIRELVETQSETSVKEAAKIQFSTVMHEIKGLAKLDGELVLAFKDLDFTKLQNLADTLADMSCRITGAIKELHNESTL